MINPLNVASFPLPILLILIATSFKVFLKSVGCGWLCRRAIALVLYQTVLRSTLTIRVARKKQTQTLWKWLIDYMFFKMKRHSHLGLKRHSKATPHRFNSRHITLVKVDPSFYAITFFSITESYQVLVTHPCRSNPKRFAPSKICFIHWKVAETHEAEGHNSSFIWTFARCYQRVLCIRANNLQKYSNIWKA